MDAKILVTLLEKHAQAIEALTRGISTEQARWKPDADTWSVLEVINHLYDEEREDFRPRLDIILNRPAEPWAPIHPGAWVTERAYNGRDLETSVENFMDERAKSLVWLGRLEEPNWEASVPTPSRGEFRAGDMFASWVAHDVLHLRQLAELHHALVMREGQPFATEYAGDW